MGGPARRDVTLIPVDLRLALGVAVALLVLAGVSWWLYRRLAVATDASAPVRRAVAAVLIAGWLLYGAAQAAFRFTDPDPWRPVIWAGLTWLGVVFYLTLGLLVLAAVSLTLRIVRRGAARTPFLRVATPVAVVLTLAVTGYGLVEAQRLRVTAYDVSATGLPAGFDGLRIALVTDLHVGPAKTAALTRRVVDLVNAQEPDLVLLGGDLSDGLERYVGADLDPLADLGAPLGVFAVTGNHEFITNDTAAFLRRWDRLGIRALRDESVTLERGGDRLVLAGLDDEQGEGEFAPDPEVALAGVDPAAFTVLLAHEPRQVVSDAGVDLQLSGHTHGGQLWPFHYVVRLQQPTLAGVDEVDGVPVVTSRGVHAPGPPLRVLAPPDVTLVTLRATGPQPGGNVL